MESGPVFGRMPKQSAATLALVITVGLVQAAGLVAQEEPTGTEKVLFEDTFTQRVGEGWQWLRSAEGGWRIREGALEIRLAHGTIDRATNLLLRPAPESSSVGGRVSAEVTISNQPTGQYEQCGIAWYYDDRQYVKLVKEVVDEKTWIIMACAVPKGGGLAGKLPFEKAGVAQLRLDVTGRQIEGWYRQAGQGEWAKVGRCELPVEGDGKICLLAFHGPEIGERWARFDDVRITAGSPR
jgi:regulation of enolase protein 1 (concanavalin A-like superfamily)